MGHLDDAYDDAPRAAHLPDVLGTWGRLIAFVGVPSVLCIGLVYWLTQNVSADLKRQADTQIETKALIEKHVIHTHEDLERIGTLLELQCENQARSLEAKNLCRAVGR